MVEGSNAATGIHEGACLTTAGGTIPKPAQSRTAVKFSSDEARKIPSATRRAATFGWL